MFGFLISPFTSSAQNQWTVELGAAVPYNIPLPLTIHQAGQRDIHLTAEYFSEPFVVPVCWVWRIAYWSDHRSWELEAIHHKIYLKNTTQEVSFFGLSHGLNLITVNRGWELDGYILRVGAGIALAHPESVVRGKVFDESGGIFKSGYYIAGPTVGCAAAKQICITQDVFLTLEGKFHASYGSVDVVEGNAHVYNIAFQGTVTFGYKFAGSVGPAGSR